MVAIMNRWKLVNTGKQRSTLALATIGPEGAYSLVSCDEKNRARPLLSGLRGDPPLLSFCDFRFGEADLDADPRARQTDLPKKSQGRCRGGSSTAPLFDTQSSTPEFFFNGTISDSGPQYSSS